MVLNFFHYFAPNFHKTNQILCNKSVSYKIFGTLVCSIYFRSNIWLFFCLYNFIVCWFLFIYLFIVVIGPLEFGVRTSPCDKKRKIQFLVFFLYRLWILSVCDYVTLRKKKEGNWRNEWSMKNRYIAYCDPATIQINSDAFEEKKANSVVVMLNSDTFLNVPESNFNVIGHLSLSLFLIQKNMWMWHKPNRSIECVLFDWFWLDWIELVQRPWSFQMHVLWAWKRLIVYVLVSMIVLYKVK